MGRRGSTRSTSPSPCEMSSGPSILARPRLTEPLGRVWLDLHGATGLEALTVQGHPNLSLVASIARALCAIMDNPRGFEGLEADWTGREPRDPDAPEPADPDIGPVVGTGEPAYGGVVLW